MIDWTRFFAPGLPLGAETHTNGDRRRHQRPASLTRYAANAADRPMTTRLPYFAAAPTMAAQELF